MSEYIDREATVALLRSLGNRDYRREKGTIQEAIKMVSFPEYTPAADVAPVQRWISVAKKLPEPETEVLVFVTHNDYDYKIITSAIYEDGKMSADDSTWAWTDIDFDYDDEKDIYIIPEGWWEYRHYNPDDVYNNVIDGVVTHWMPLPEPPKGE